MYLSLHLHTSLSHLEQQIGSKKEKEYIKAVYCHPAYLTYAEYIMRNAGLEEAQAAIKIAGRNISNLRYADDTTLAFMCIHAKLLQLCLTLCNPVDCSQQASLSMGFSGQEYWSRLPCPPPGDLPNPGIEPTSLTSPALAGGFFTTSTTWEPHWTL